jgi:ribA/ribD-fused uncharacterized protein
MIDVSRYRLRSYPEMIAFWGGPPSQWYLDAPFRQRFVSDGSIFAFNCAEQYMMAAKALLFGDKQVFDAIMVAEAAKTQKDLGRQVKGLHTARWTDADKDLWEKAAPDVLVRGNLAKFSQNPDILEWLLSTGGKQLVEGSPTDRIYGVGMRYDDPRIQDPTNWQGLNLLGRALETVRERLSHITPT